MLIEYQDLKFETSGRLFSPKQIDKGTLAMLSVLQLKEGDKLLDLGCGYGFVGIWAAKIISSENVVMCDSDKVAVEAAKSNAKLNGMDIKTVLSDGFTSLDDIGFDYILSNPPYHSDFSVPKHFIEKGYNRLKLGGKFLMVTKRKEWYKNKLTAIFGGVKVIEIDDYFVFISEKRSTQYSKR